MNGRGPVGHQRRAAGQRMGTVRFAAAVYVLHALQKKSKAGITTPQEDVKLIGQRLKRAQQDDESRGTP